MIEEQLAASIFNFVMGMTDDRSFGPEIIDGYDCYFDVTTERKRRYVNDHEPEETVYLISVFIEKIEVWDEDGSESFEMDHTAVQEGLDKLLYEFNKL